MLGKPAPPKPEINTVAPSATSARASAAVLTRLSIGISVPHRSAKAARALPRGTRQPWPGTPRPQRRGLDLRIDQFDDAAHVENAVAVGDMHAIVGRCRVAPPSTRRRAHPVTAL